MSFFTFGGKLILYDDESIPLVSNTIWAYMRPRLLASNSSLYTTYLKHAENIKFKATNINDLSLDSSVKVKYTLKVSAMYLLPSSRKLTKSVFVDIP